MFSLACKFSEEILLPNCATNMLKKSKSFVDQYDGGLVTSATTKIDEMTKDLADGVEQNVTCVLKKRDSFVDDAYAYADSKLAPLKDETKCESFTGKVTSLPVKVLFRVKSKGAEFATSKFEEAKSKVAEVGTPYYTQATDLGSKYVQLGKEKAFATYELESVQKAVTYATTTAELVKKDYFLPFHKRVSEKLGDLCAHDQVKQAKTFVLDAKARIITSDAYAKAVEGVEYLSTCWPITVAIEYGNCAWKTGLKYFSLLSSSSTA